MIGFFRLCLRWLEAPIGVGVPLVGLIAVLLAPQMPDMFAGMGYSVVNGNLDHAWYHQLGFGVAAVALGFEGWYWSRAATSATLLGPDVGWRQPSQIAEKPHWSYEWAPRAAPITTALLCVAPLLMLLRGQIAADSINWVSLAISLAMVGLLFLLTIFRVRLGLYRITTVAHWVWRSRVTATFASAPFGWQFASLLLLISAIGSWLIACRPSAVEQLLQTPSAALLALALVIGPLTLVLQLFRDLAYLVVRLIRQKFGMEEGREWRVAANLLAVFLLIAWTFGDPVGGYHAGHYSVRPFAKLGDGTSCPHETSVAGVASWDERPCLEGALRSWIAARRQAGDIGRIPLIVLAAEGGASRAAVWTLSTIRVLDARTGGEFGRHLFAISGVSGGSLGATSYLEELAAHPSPGQALDWTDDATIKSTRELARGDLFAVSVATYFYNDVLAHLVGPVWSADDRGVALERAFERFWARYDVRSNEKSDTMPQDGLFQLWSATWKATGGTAPHMLLNGTSLLYGRRLITSTLRFDIQPDVFPGAADLLATITCDVRVSTAVTNSARFPYLSPAGRFGNYGGDCMGGSGGEGQQILDGGYFENYGARTALDLVEAIERLGDLREDIEPIVVLASDDAEATPDDTAPVSESDIPAMDEVSVSCLSPALSWNLARISERMSRQTSSTLASEGLAPVLGLAALRGAHNADALQLLRAQMCPPSTVSQAYVTKNGSYRAGIPAGHLFNMALPKPGPTQSAPMNWVLNPTSCQFLLDQAPFVSFNKRQADALAALLSEILHKPIKAANNLTSGCFD